MTTFCQRIQVDCLDVSANTPEARVARLMPYADAVVASMRTLRDDTYTRMFGTEHVGVTDRGQPYAPCLSVSLCADPEPMVTTWISLRRQDDHVKFQVTLATRRGPGGYIIRHEYKYDCWTPGACGECYANAVLRYAQEWPELVRLQIDTPDRAVLHDVTADNVASLGRQQQLRGNLAVELAVQMRGYQVDPRIALRRAGLERASSHAG